MKQKKQNSPPPASPATSPAAPGIHFRPWMLFALLALLLALVFYRSWIPGLTLASGDANLLSNIRNHNDMIPYGYLARWFLNSGMGLQGAAIPIAPGWLLAHVFSPGKYIDALYISHLFLLGVFSFFLLLDLTKHRGASLLGSIWMMFQPYVFSHILPGHLGHLLLCGWIPGAFLFLRIAIRTHHFSFWGLSGACMGLAMSSGTTDVALFWAMMLGVYGIFLILRQRRFSPEQDKSFPMKKAAGLVLNISVAIMMFLLIGYQCILMSVGMEKRGYIGIDNEVASQNNEQASREKWFWATQWSIPVEETLDFAFPGFFGWGSSNPSNPYRGRIGQTEGFLQHRQGLPNLNDVSTYLGATILLASLIGLFVYRKNGDAWFFALFGIGSCLLAYGKFAPFYRGFFLLPHMDAMRNPIKWFYLTSFCVGIVGTMGLAAVLTDWQNRIARWPKPILIGLLFSPGLLLAGLGKFYLVSRQNNPDALFWQNPAFVRLSSESLVLGSIFWLAAAVIFFILLRPSKPATNTLSPRPITIPVLVIGGLLLTELIYVNRHYMPYQSSVLEHNGGPLAPFFDNQAKPFRIKIIGDDPVFNYIRQVLTLYYRWEHIETIVSRTVDESLLFQKALSRDPHRLLQLSNVRFVIGPANLGDSFLKPVLSFSGANTPAAVYQFSDALTRYFLVSDWKVVPPQKRFEAIAEKDFEPARQVLIHDLSGTVPPVPTPQARQMICRIDSYNWHRIRLTVETDAQAMLVGLDRFDADWKAFIDGKPLDIWKANGFVRACPIPPGHHTVEFRLIGQGWKPIIIVLIGWLGGVVCAIWGWRYFKRSSLSDPSS